MAMGASVGSMPCWIFPNEENIAVTSVNRACFVLLVFKLLLIITLKKQSDKMPLCGTLSKKFKNIIFELYFDDFRKRKW